jgi:hypothetical protein
MSENRTIRVEALTRVEGEGGLHVRLNGNVVDRWKMFRISPPEFVASVRWRIR